MRPGKTTGIAIRANVAEETDARIREQIGRACFRSGSRPRTSGESYWPLDVIAPSQKVAIALLANFKQIVNDKPVSIRSSASSSIRPCWRR